MAEQIFIARDLPEIRAELAAWLADPGEFGGPETWARHQQPHIAVRERQAARDHGASLRAAQLFFIAADMTHTAVSAGLALPAYRLHPDDLPAPHGLLLWEDPVTEGYHGGEWTGAPIVAASWAVHGRGVRLRLWCSREDWLTSLAEGDPSIDLRALTPAEVRVRRLRNPQPIVALYASHLPFGKIPGWLAATPQHTTDLTPGGLAALEESVRTGTHIEQAERALVVSWLLMGQTLIREEAVHPPKATVKRINRLNPDLPTAVRYVQLRHRTTPADQRAHTDGPKRTYSHRWVVRGHWRNHWYPSRQAHRPIWIDNHVKGPDGAPILDPDKLVNVLRR